MEWAILLLGVLGGIVTAALGWVPMSVVVFLLTLVAFSLANSTRRGSVWLLIACMLLTSSLVCGYLVNSGGDGSLDAWAFGMVVGLLLASSSIIFTAVLNSEVYFARAGLDRIYSLMATFAFGLGLPLPIQVIRNGGQSWSRPDGEWTQRLGPGYVIVDAGHAVVLESTGRITRVVCPGAGQREGFVQDTGFAVTGRFEMIRDIIDLRVQQESLVVEDAMTVGAVPLNIKAEIFYQVAVDEDALLRESVYRCSEETIRRAALGASDWREATRAAARSAMQEVIAMYRLEELFAPTSATDRQPTIVPRERLRRQFLAVVNDRSQAWGVRVVDAYLEAIGVPQEVSTAESLRHVKAAEADAQATTTRLRGRAEVEFMRTVGRLRERACEDAFGKLLVALNESGAVLDSDTLSQCLSLMAEMHRNIAQDSACRFNYMRALEEISRNPNARLIISQGNAPLVISDVEPSAPSG